MRIEDFRFSSSSIDDFYSPPVRCASAGSKVRISSASQLGGFVHVSHDKLVHLSQQDFWKLGKDSDGFYIERLVDDMNGPVGGLPSRDNEELTAADLWILWLTSNK